MHQPLVSKQISIRLATEMDREQIYRLRHDVVEITTVFHGARLFRLD